MASALMHIAVAKKVNNYLKMEDKMLYLGTIAPDISKEIDEPRNKSHFIEGEGDTPNVNAFYNKYKEYLNNPFEMGYYIHLLTDYYWFNDFMPQRINRSTVKTLDGQALELDDDEISRLIYSDYTNVNVDIIEEYDLDLKLFYEEMVYPRSVITEIPINKLQAIVDKMGLIIENSTYDNNYVLDTNDIHNFIDETADIIIETLKEQRKV